MDIWRWRNGVYGIYSTKATYEVLLRNKFDMGVECKEFTLVWNKLVLPKVRVHAWRMLWEKVPTTTKLLRRNYLTTGVDTNCMFCNSDPESVTHNFLECEFLYKTWMSCLNWFGVKATLPSNPTSIQSSCSRGVGMCNMADKERPNF
ncbi:hypothetical protein ACS0TY_034751 [Phlomoides rotata]